MKLPALIFALGTVASAAYADGPAGYNFLVQATAKVVASNGSTTTSGSFELFYISKSGTFYFQDAAGALGGFGGTVVKSGSKGCARERNDRLLPQTHCYTARFDESSITFRVNHIKDDVPGVIDQWDYLIKISGTKCKVSAAKHQRAHYSIITGLNRYKVRGYSSLSCKMALGPLGHSSELD